MRRFYEWAPDTLDAPGWLIKAVDGVKFAFFQMPKPDNRWVYVYQGKILQPFDNRARGWEQLHELIKHKCLLIPKVESSDEEILAKAELTRRIYNRDTSAGTDEHVHYNRSGERKRLHGLDTISPAGKIMPDRWRTCVDDARRQCHGVLDYALQTIERQSTAAARHLKACIKYENHRWTFRDAVNWMTELGVVPSDARIELQGKNWLVTMPETEQLTIPRCTPGASSLDAIARIFLWGQLSGPSGLAVSSDFLNEFLDKPDHLQLFTRTYNRPKVVTGQTENPIERAICGALQRAAYQGKVFQLSNSWSYRADYVISKESPLCSICGLQSGTRVTLRRFEALRVILDVVEQQKPRLFWTREPSAEFADIVDRLQRAIIFAKKQEALLARVQTESEICKDRLYMGIYRLRESLFSKGDWQNNYGRFASYIKRFIRTGDLCQHTGPYKWEVVGVKGVLDIVEAAMDHLDYKIAKRKRAERKKEKVLRVARAISPRNQFLAGGQNLVMANDLVFLVGPR